MTHQREFVMLNKFSSLTYLIELKFANSRLNDADMWLLPESLENYDVSYNEFTYLDISMCPNMKNVTVHHNLLTKLPKLSVPAPPIQSFSFGNSMLQDLNVEYFAPLCNLKHFEWEAPRNSFLSTMEGGCECLRLKNWMTILFRITGAQLYCKVIPDKVIIRIRGLIYFQIQSIPIRISYTDNRWKFIIPQRWIAIWLLALLNICVSVVRMLMKYQIHRRKQIFGVFCNSASYCVL